MSRGHTWSHCPNKKLHHGILTLVGHRAIAVRGDNILCKTLCQAIKISGIQGPLILCLEVSYGFRILQPYYSLFQSHNQIQLYQTTNIGIICIRGASKKRDQPVAPCNPFSPAVALLTFPAVVLLSGSGSSYLSGSGCFPMELRCSALASKSFPMALRHGALASNKPHPAEKSTPVWLAIWRTWAGFANSQLRHATFATPDNICAHSSLLPHWIAAQTLANLSAHLHRLPTPPPYLRRMRLSHGRGRRCWVVICNILMAVFSQS